MQTPLHHIRAGALDAAAASRASRRPFERTAPALDNPDHNLPQEAPAAFVRAVLGRMAAAPGVEGG
jgi:hypothetical protein